MHFRDFLYRNCNDIVVLDFITENPSLEILVLKTCYQNLSTKSSNLFLILKL
jgi:hypothetical protein